VVAFALVAPARLRRIAVDGQTPRIASARLLGGRFRHIGAAVAVASLALGGAGLGEESPNGPQIEVNDYTSGTQHAPALAMDAQGNFVVVWESSGSGGSDNAGYSIQARRFAASGSALGAQFQVNSYTTSQQRAPAVAMDGGGNFVVVWESIGATLDSSYSSIQAQRYAANGLPQGAQFQVNSYTTGSQWRPTVAVRPSGDFVVAWMSAGSSSSDTDGYSIQARRFAADGSPLPAGQFQVNSRTTGDQEGPSVAVDSLGNFVIVWQGTSSDSDNDGWSVHAQAFDSNGAPTDTERQVNAYTTADQVWPKVWTAGGAFVVAWTSFGSDGTDTDAESIQVRPIVIGGAAFPQFQLNEYTTSVQKSPALALDPQDNTFISAWASFGGADPDYSIVARRHDFSSPLGADFQVNTYTTLRQVAPSLAVDGQGNFVVAWASEGSSGADTSGYSIQAQRFDALFRDGFEASTTVRWSLTVQVVGG
jgi:hypothetical protein